MVVVLTKTIVTIALSFAITIALAKKSINFAEQKSPSMDSVASSTISPKTDKPLPMPSKRVSRFLQEGPKNPRAADHCNKNEQVCYIEGGRNSTCCNNKCVDLYSDDKNCGACKRKCKFTQTCCRGECVYISLDKRHCGACNHRCNPAEYCVYGMCNYSI